MYLMVDNYDSFVYNLACYLQECGEQVELVRNDKIIIQSGDDKLEIGDRVIVITKIEKLSNINDIISGGHR